MSRGERFARNVGWGLAGQIAVALINLVAIPRLVRGFGVETYGLYLLLHAAAGWVGTLHFGTGNSLIRWAAESHAAGRRAALDDAIRHGGLLLVGGAAVGGLALWGAAPFLAERVFSVSAADRAHAVLMIRAAAFSSVFAAITSGSCAAFQGLHRFNWQTTAAVLQGLLIPLVVLGALSVGHGLGAAAAGVVAVQGLVAGFCAFGLLRLRAELKEGGTGVGFRAFFRYSIGFWPASVAQLVSGQLDRAFIAGLRSMSEFTLYAVPGGMLSRLQTLPQTAAVALLPIVVGDGKGDREAVVRPYLRASRVLIGLVVPAHALLFALMPQFLSLWLGGRFGDASVWPARLLVLAQAAGLLFFLPNAVAAARRDGWWASAATWGQAIVCLALWPWMIPRWGLFGAALGGLIAQVLSTGAFVIAVHSGLLSLSWPRFARESVAPAAAGVAALLLLVWPLRTRVTGWVSFFALCAAAGALYTVIFWRLLPDEDRSFLRARLPI